MDLQKFQKRKQKTEKRTGVGTQGIRYTAEEWVFAGLLDSDPATIRLVFKMIDEQKKQKSSSPANAIWKLRKEDLQ